MTQLGGFFPSCLGYIGDEKTTQSYGEYFINHEIRIPIKQPVAHLDILDRITNPHRENGGKHPWDGTGTLNNQSY